MTIYIVIIPDFVSLFCFHSFQLTEMFWFYSKYKHPWWFLHPRAVSPINNICRPDRRRPPVEGGGAAPGRGITSRCVRGSQGESRLQTSSSVQPGCASIWKETFALLWTVCHIYISSVWFSLCAFVAVGFVIDAALKSWTPPRSMIRMRHVHSRISDVELSALLFFFIHGPCF